MIYTKDIRDYVKKGQYDKDLKKIVKQAKTLVNYELLTNPKNKAVIIDIDETILSNLPYISQQIHLNDVVKLNRWQMSSKCEAIEPIVSLYGWLLDRDVKIYFITARPLELKKATIDNFKKLSIPPSQIVFRDQDQWPVPKEFKIAMRKNIVNNDYDIILNIGDQPTDFEGGYWKRALKVPNPFYIESKLPWQKDSGVAA
ncbi:MAG: HAD family acid phosphatase [Pseudomonadota bacterium]|nr:HAD family acid phosphatase [Pseudomonadota bacterium]